MQKIYLYLRHATYGEVEITEPLKTDAFAYTVEQEKGRYGRDVVYGGDEIPLRFEDVYGIAISSPQTLPDGRVVNHLTMGLPYILAAWRLTGFETKMELIAKDYWGNTISTGELDFSDASFKTDGLTYAECKVIQDSRRAEIKRQAETNIDLFSTLDLSGNPIQPISTERIFVKATPQQQRSNWTSNDLTAIGYATATGDENDYSVNRAGVNKANVTGSYGIERSLGFISNRYSLVPGVDGFYPNDGNNFTYVKFVNEFTGGHIDITNVIGTCSQGVSNFGGVDVLAGAGTVKLTVCVGTLGQYNNPRWKYSELIHTFSYTGGIDPDITSLPTSFSIDLPLCIRGEYLWIYFEPNVTGVTYDGVATPSPIFGASYRVLVTLDNLDIEITGTSTAVSSVVTGVRYHDIYKQILLSINGSPLISTRTNTGFLAPVYAFNGNLLRGITDRPFNVTFKDRFERLEAFDLDYQVCTGFVYVGNESDYKPNNEVIQLTETPDNDFFYETSERATRNLMEMKFTGYLNKDEQDSTDAATLTAVHTETQYSFPNKRCENILSVDVKDILDPITIEEARKNAITTKPNTTTKYDEKIMLLDTIAIPPDTTWTLTAYLLQQIDEDGNLRILNTGDIDDTEGNYFDWRSLGFSQGSTVEILDGGNAGTYTATLLEYSLAVFTPVSASPSFEGLSIVNLEYPLDDVELMNRTTEGFTIAVEGFSNQRFTPKRLALLRGTTLANICRYYPNGEIKVTKPPINADFTTQLTSEAEPVIENTPIQVSTLPSPIVTPNIIKTRAALTLAQAKQVFEALETINDDGTIGGYITVRGELGTTRRIYPQKADWLLLSEYAELSGEEKN